MRLPSALVLTAALACGSSSPPDVCEQTVSLLEAEAAKIQSCIPDAGPPDAGPPDAGNSDGGAADAGNGGLTGPAAEVKSCEANLKSCRPADLTAWQSELDCQQALLPDIQCQWYTEANRTADQTYFAYQQAQARCTAMFSPPSPVCASAQPQ